MLRSHAYMSSMYLVDLKVSSSSKTMFETDLALLPCFSCESAHCVLLPYHLHPGPWCVPHAPNCLYCPRLCRATTLAPETTLWACIGQSEIYFSSFSCGPIRPCAHTSKKSKLDSHWIGSRPFGPSHPQGHASFYPSPWPFPSSLSSICNLTVWTPNCLSMFPDLHPLPFIYYCTLAITHSTPFLLLALFFPTLEPSWLQQHVTCHGFTTIVSMWKFDLGCESVPCLQVTHIICGHLWGKLWAGECDGVPKVKGSEGCVHWQTWMVVVEAVWPETFE